jgi:hypothetical protein
MLIDQDVIYTVAMLLSQTKAQKHAGTLYFGRGRAAAHIACTKRLRISCWFWKRHLLNMFCCMCRCADQPQRQSLRAKPRARSKRSATESITIALTTRPSQKTQ